MNTNHCHFFVTCAKGTEGALRSELVALRIRGPRGARGGVSFDGTFMDGMKVCLHSRVAMRVLLELASFEAHDADELYGGARAVDWTELIGRDMTLAVRATTQDNPSLRHSGFCALKVKDAIVDMLRDRVGRRPDVDHDSPDVSVVLHLRAAEAHLFVDLAGQPLHRRGYRAAMVAAPIKESLAAAILQLGSVPVSEPFLDPMAGSGTLAIEHALAARKIAPGLGRSMSFERWASPEQNSIWESLRRAAREATLPSAPAPILARDLDPAALEAARTNANAAGVGSDIVFELADVARLEAPYPHGTLCTNPPYGERLETSASGADIERFYQSLARAFDRLHGWRAVCLSGNPAFAKHLKRKPSISHRLSNGAIEARLLVFEL